MTEGTGRKENQIKQMKKKLREMRRLREEMRRPRMEKRVSVLILCSVISSFKIYY